MGWWKKPHVRGVLKALGFGVEAKDGSYYLRPYGPAEGGGVLRIRPTGPTLPVPFPSEDVAYAAIVERERMTVADVLALAETVKARQAAAAAALTHEEILAMIGRRPEQASGAGVYPDHDNRSLAIEQTEHAPTSTFKIVVPSRSGKPWVVSGFSSRAEAAAKLIALRKQKIPAIKQNAPWEILAESEPHEFVVKLRLRDEWWLWDGDLSLWRSHTGKATRFARSAADDVAGELRRYYGARKKDLIVEPAPSPDAEPPSAITVSLTKRLGIYIG